MQTVNSRALRENMPTFRNFSFLTLAIMVASGYPTLLRAQSAAAASRKDSISLHISLTKNNYAVGDKPTVVMTVKNIRTNQICLSTASPLYRIYVTSKDGEARKTELHRHMLGDFRAGDSPTPAGGSVVCRSIEPGSVDSLTYDLTAYYDLGTPGDYSVYLEIYAPDDPANRSGHWLRTNIVNFKVQAQAQ
jgi:hypothetical protein